MCEVAVFTAGMVNAEAHGPKLELLSAEARAIVDELPALVQLQEDGAVATILGGDLEEAQAGYSYRGAGSSALRTP